jgi:glycosyltransferase involved in cell wall biosynthesis
VSRRVVALVAARDEAARIGACVSALRELVGEVVVVDDCSRDDTASVARRAGASVIRTGRRRGKGSALEGAIGRLGPADVWLFADGDLGATAARLGGVLEPVIAGDADLAIAVFPPAHAGGFGLVKRAAAAGIRGLTSRRTVEPLSGQRAISGMALDAVRPLARGFGMEAAMTIDAVRAGLRVEEIHVDGLDHRPTFRDLRGFVHRARQGFDILLAVAPRAIGLR